MTQIRELMTPDPVTCAASETLAAAARHMRDNDIGDVIVMNGDQVAGVATDRDIVVRGVADGCDPNRSTLGEVCSSNVVSISPTDNVEQAMQLMREHSLRRLPVVENGRPVGIVSIGDLAVERDPDSVLADISAAPANN